MRSVEDILVALAEHLKTMTDLKGADAIFPGRMGTLPRAVLVWNNCPTVDVGISALLQVWHSIDVYIVVAPRSSVEQATKEVVTITNKVIEHLLRSVTLNGIVTQLKPTSIRPATLTLGEEAYFASVITLQVEDKTTYQVGA